MADRCQCCGALTEVAYDPLVAACDVLVLRALELIGMRVVRARSVPGDRRVREETGRTRYARMRDERVPWHHAHMLWPAADADVDTGLASAWANVGLVLDEHGCCGATPGQVATILDRYVRDLIAARQGHDVTELRYRLGAYLGVPA